jgi:HPt (histidine-containing phosphotransfer) domain-containing protein
MASRSLQEFLEAAGAEYRSGLAGRLRAVEGLWRALAEDGKDEKKLADLLRELHSLAGSAKTFGLAAVSEAARTAETFLEPYGKKGTVPAGRKGAEFERLIETLSGSAKQS